MVLPQNLPSSIPASVSLPLSGGLPLSTLTWAILPWKSTAHVCLLFAELARVGPRTAAARAAIDRRAHLLMTPPLGFAPPIPAEVRRAHAGVLSPGHHAGAGGGHGAVMSVNGRTR